MMMSEDAPYSIGNLWQRRKIVRVAVAVTLGLCGLLSRCYAMMSRDIVLWLQF